VGGTPCIHPELHLLVTDAQALTHYSGPTEQSRSAMKSQESTMLILLPDGKMQSQTKPRSKVLSLRMMAIISPLLGLLVTHIAALPTF
jgi:hypothetical protein